jgi:nucleotide-binding universal stress UspA family protein/nitrite reductase/ring-hydroxylating ferredoxin subunit
LAYRRIVVATDGSDSAETAETIASTLASIGGANLTIAHAYGNPERANEAVARAEQIADREGARHELALSAEPPADAILMTADEKEAELIVIGSVGFSTSDQLFGSVSRRVVTHAPCDVLLTRARTIGEHEKPAPPYRRILIATDGSSTADRAARKGFVLANALKASVTLLFVGHPKTGELVLQDTVATIGSETGVTSAIEIRSGDPSDEIVDAAASEGFDLVVIGNRGMTGAKAAMLGSVPRDVAESAPCDVLVARTVAQNLDEIGPDEGGIVKMADHKVAVYRDKKGNLTILSAKCTHQGCTVKWDASEHGWLCPCHGSRYSATGQVVAGPAERPLSPTDL